MKRAVLLGVLLLVGLVAIVGGTTIVSLDGDGIPAFREITNGTNPLSADTDGDGLLDDEEIEHGTDPTSSDTDGDGLDDASEVSGQTDPLVADTDGDGLDDGAELTHGSDPTVNDTDGDGLGDGEEIHEYGTDPTRVDTDGDRLEDGWEVTHYGTDPTEPDSDEIRAGLDSDGDGLPDVSEIKSGPLQAGDPFRKDIFVEIDYMVGQKPPEAVLDPVRDAYAQAPVENPDGSTGISLHLLVNDSIPLENTTTKADRDRLMAEHFDHEDRGYHYAIAVADARLNGGNFRGYAESTNNGEFVFQTSPDIGFPPFPTEYTASLFMHELGHSVGLSGYDYVGIDTTQVPIETYTSVMNYNSPWLSVTYSDGEPFDDWEHISDHMFTPDVRVPD